MSIILPLSIQRYIIELCWTLKWYGEERLFTFSKLHNTLSFVCRDWLKQNQLMFKQHHLYSYNIYGDTFKQKYIDLASPYSLPQTVTKLVLDVTKSSRLKESQASAPSPYATTSIILRIKKSISNQFTSSKHDQLEEFVSEMEKSEKKRAVFLSNVECLVLNLVLDFDLDESVYKRFIKLIKTYCLKLKSIETGPKTSAFHTYELETVAGLHHFEKYKQLYDGIIPTLKDQIESIESALMPPLPDILTSLTHLRQLAVHTNVRVRDYYLDIDQGYDIAVHENALNNNKNNKIVKSSFNYVLTEIFKAVPKDTIEVIRCHYDSYSYSNDKYKIPYQCWVDDGVVFKNLKQLHEVHHYNHVSPEYLEYVGNQSQITSTITSLYYQALAVELTEYDQALFDTRPDITDWYLSSAGHITKLSINAKTAKRLKLKIQNMPDNLLDYKQLRELDLQTQNQISNQFINMVSTYLIQYHQYINNNNSNNINNNNHLRMFKFTTFITQPVMDDEDLPLMYRNTTTKFEIIDTNPLVNALVEISQCKKKLEYIHFDVRDGRSDDIKLLNQIKSNPIIKSNYIMEIRDQFNLVLLSHDL